MGNRVRPKYLRQFLMLLLTTLFLSPQNLHADTYSYDFTGDLYIWDISDTYSDDSMGCSMSLTLNQDSKGKITGGGTVTCYDSGVYMDMSYSIKGSIKQKDGIATEKISMKFKGTASYMGESYNLSASLKITGEIDPNSQSIYGTMKTKVKVAGESMSETSSYYETLPMDMDGSFNLTFDVNQDGKKLLGNGELTLSNGETHSFSVKGKTSDKKGESKCSLKGDSCKLKLIINAINGSLISIKGKALGQKLAM